MIRITDQLGNTISLPSFPQRIISLVPSQTELLFYLGLGDQIQGVTKFCVHPNPEVKKKTIIGGTKRFRFDVIDELKPDLILSNKEENYKEGIDLLKQKYPVWTSDIVSFKDAFEMIQSVGVMTNTEEKAKELIYEIDSGLNSISIKSNKRSAVYLIWNKPLMLVGEETFIDTVLTKLGFLNLASKLDGRYPETSIEELKKLNPDFIFLSSEPFPFKEEHKEEFEKIFPESKTVLVDGEMFSWYGNRMLVAVDYFNSLLKRLDREP